MWLLAYWPGLVQYSDPRARKEAVAEKDALWLAAKWPGALRDAAAYDVSAPALPAFPA